MTGPQIKKLRRRLGWTLREMADFLGYADYKYVSRMERDDYEARGPLRIVLQRGLRDGLLCDAAGKPVTAGVWANWKRQALPAYLAEVRSSRGWTQTELANRLGLNCYQQVWRWEKGLAEVPKRVLLALSLV